MGLQARRGVLDTVVFWSCVSLEVLKHVTFTCLVYSIYCKEVGERWLKILEGVMKVNVEMSEEEVQWCLRNKLFFLLLLRWEDLVLKVRMNFLEVTSSLRNPSSIFDKSRESVFASCRS